MPTLLQLDSSADLRSSRSRELTAAFAHAWLAAGPDRQVRVRDLHRDPLPHLPDPAMHWPERLRPADAVVPAAAEALQRELLEELIAADVLLVGAALYNYSLPSTLKAWLDYIHVPGVTASFDVEVQPLAGRPAIVVIARGGSYAPGSPTEGWDHATPPLEIVLGASLGMDVSVVATDLTLADSVALLADQREEAHAQFDAARTELLALAVRLG